MFPPFQQWFVELMDVLSNIAIIITMVIAIIGLLRWRFELFGRKKFDLSQKIILLAYEFRDQLLLFREKIAWFEGRMFQLEGKRISHSEEILKREMSDIFRFLQPLIDSKNKFHALKWEANIILYPEDINPIQHFEDALDKLRKAVQHYYSQQITQARTSQAGRSCPFPENQMEEWCHIVFGKNDNEDDQVLTMIEQGLEELKEGLKKYLQ